jgi:hypothetical protein
MSILEPWGSVNSEPDYYEKELYIEVGKKNILYGKKVSAIGRRYDCDDILYILNIMHLKNHFTNRLNINSIYNKLARKLRVSIR